MSITPTLPREIVKWIQSLDLSYSFKDMKRLIYENYFFNNLRDLTNGFLIAEIFTRYYPGKIQMHSFDNSQNQSRRQNNWLILEKFFKKFEIPLNKNDYIQILNDNDIASLVEFMSKMYSFLTQKKITKPPLLNFLQTNKDVYNEKFSEKNLGTSFILKDKGLEKIEEKKILSGDNLIKEIQEKEKEKEKEKENNKLENEANISAPSNSSPNKKTNFLRNFNKPISQNLETGNLQIDVKDIKVKQVNLNFSKLKDQDDSKLGTPPQNSKSSIQKEKKLTLDSSHQHKLSNHEELIKATTLNTENKNTSSPIKKDKPIEKTIFDALNEIITIRFSIKNYSKELENIKVKNSTILQVYCDNIDLFSDDFSTSFFDELLQQTESLIKFVFKDQNELWKYLNFLFGCLKNLTIEGKSFNMLTTTIKVFGEKCLEYNPQNAFRTRMMFQNYYLQGLASQIKKCPKFERKEALLQILYSFCASDGTSRFEMCMTFKKTLKCHSIYLQSLVVLMKYERELREDNKQMIEELFHNANLYLFSGSSNLRTMSLAIFNYLCDLNIDRVTSLLEHKINEIANSEWWESKCQAIFIFSKMIKGIVESDKYQNLMKQNNSTHKSFSLENEQMMAKLNEKIELISKGMQMISLPPGNEYILRCSFIAICEIIGNHKSLIELFIHLFLLSNEDTRKWVFYSTNSEQDLNKEEYLIESDKSLRYKINIRSQEFEKYASNILIYIVEMIKEMKLDRLNPEYMDLIVYGFTFTDFKMINMELCENINNSLKEYIFIALCDDEMCENAKIILNQILKLQFFSEVKVKDAEKLFGSAICLIYQNKNEICIKNVEEILVFLMKEVTENGVELIKRFLIEVYKNIRQRAEIYLRTTNLKYLFEPISISIEKNEVESNLPKEDKIENEIKESAIEDEGKVENSENEMNSSNQSPNQDTEIREDENVEYEEDENGEEEEEN